MGSYYYLTAQLPYLVYGQAAPMSTGAFRGLCKESLSAGDAALLEYCSLDPQKIFAGPDPYKAPAPTASAFINGWREREWALRLSLAQQRGQRLKREIAPGGAPLAIPEEAAATAKAALALESPLEAELLLDRSRWNAIETLRGMDGFSYFDVNTIYAYLLKLLLMERRALFKQEEGFGEYKRLYTAIMEEASASIERDFAG